MPAKRFTTLSTFLGWLRTFNSPDMEAVSVGFPPREGHVKSFHPMLRPIQQPVNGTIYHSGDYFEYYFPGGVFDIAQLTGAFYLASQVQGMHSLYTSSVLSPTSRTALINAIAPDRRWAIGVGDGHPVSDSVRAYLGVLPPTPTITPYNVQPLVAKYFPKHVDRIMAAMAAGVADPPPPFIELEPPAPAPEEDDFRPIDYGDEEEEEEED